MKNFEIGQKVWFSEPWSKMPKNATIVSFETIEPDKVYKFERKVAKLHWDEGGINSMLVDNLYSTKEEVLCAEKEKSRKRIEKFKEEIKDVKDLIQFMFDNVVSTGAEEYVDWDARTAVIERSKELLNIDFE